MPGRIADAGVRLFRVHGVGDEVPGWWIEGIISGEAWHRPFFNKLTPYVEAVEDDCTRSIEQGVAAPLFHPCELCMSCDF